MFDDEDQPKKKTSEFPRHLENMSVTELEEYIEELKAEISRAEADIKQKRAASDAASAFFKN